MCGCINMCMYIYTCVTVKWLPKADVGGVFPDYSSTHIWRYCLSEPRAVSIWLTRLLQTAPILPPHSSMHTESSVLVGCHTHSDVPGVLGI